MAFLNKYLGFDRGEAQFWVEPQKQRLQEAKKVYDHEEKAHFQHKAKMLAKYGDSYIGSFNQWLNICGERMDAARFKYNQRVSYYRRLFYQQYYAVFLNSLYRQKLDVPVEVWENVWRFLLAQL